MDRSKKLTLLVLLVVAVAINYIDRGTLSVAKPDLSKEFQLDDTQMGFLFSAFFWSYALFQIVAGWLVDRYDVKWVYAIGFLVWSVATAAMGVLSGFWVFFALRLLLGIGESVAYPATSRLLAANYAEEQRGFANALIDAGTKIGPALSTLLGGLVVAHYGWRALFLFVGIGSLLWLIPWLWLVPSEKRTAKESGIATPPRESGVAWPVLLMRREVWVTSLGMFCLGYAWYFLVSWLPAYLVEERGFSKEDMAVFGSLPFWAMAVTSLLGGWCSDRWIRGGGTPTRVRKTFLITGFLLCALFMVVAVRATEAGRCVAFLTAACAALGFYSSNVWAVTQTLAGTAAAGRWTGLQNCVGNLGGVVSPIVTGMIVTRTGSFTLAFTASAAMLLLGAVLYAVLLGRIVPIEWPRRDAEIS
jgi:MFS family permease